MSITGKMFRPHLLQSMVDLTTCDQHGEKNKFFCEEDQAFLCDSCLLAPGHKDHQVLPLEIAAKKCKDKLEETQAALRKKIEEFEIALDMVRKRETACEEYSDTLELSIYQEYAKMHGFFWKEEDQYLNTLDQKSGDNLLIMEEGQAKLSQQIQNIQRMILDVEDNLDKFPLEMLQDMRGILERKEKLLLQKPELPLPACPTQPTHFITGLREMLMNFQRDITLDPETANPHLILSEDLKSVQYGSVPQDLPNNKERFDCALIVLGTQIFTSGKHYWEVDVGTKTEWEVGICDNSIIRKGKFSSSSEAVRTLAGFTTANGFVLRNAEKNLQFRRPIHKIGIFLDYEKGHIAFYDVTKRSLIQSLSDIPFEGPLRPFFSPCLPNEKSSPGSLIICPRNNQERAVNDANC